jgi:hypothetical protein
MGLDWSIFSTGLTEWHLFRFTLVGLEWTLLFIRPGFWPL